MTLRAEVGRVRRVAWVPALLLMLALTFPAAALAGSEEGRIPALLIRTWDGLLTVRATEVPHGQILEGLARELGFKLVIVGSLEERRSLTFEGRPWEEALKKAIAPANWAFVYQPSAQQSMPALVFVFPAGAEKASGAFPATRAPGPPPPPVAVEAVAKQRALLSPSQQEQMKAAIAEILEGQDEETWAMLTLVSLATMAGEEEGEPLRGKLQDRNEEAWLRAAAEGLREAFRNEPEGLKRAAQEALGWLLQGSK